MREEELNPMEKARAERGRAMIAAAVEQTRAPLALRERIEAQRTRRRPARRSWALGGTLGGAVAAAIVAIVLTTGGGGAGLSVAQAADLATLGPSAPAPAVDAARPSLLKRSIDGVAYPSWKGQFPWRASGAREDKLHGRRTVTVFYDNPQRQRIGYTIVAGDPLDEPAGPSMRHGSEHYVVLSRGERTVVTWRRDGHTCVLSGPESVPRERLLALASWSGTETS